MNANKNATRTGWTDPDDAPELTDAFFEQADEYKGDKLVRRGRPTGTSKPDTTRKQVTLRIPPDVLERWKATGPGWQTRMVERLSAP